MWRSVNRLATAIERLADEWKRHNDGQVEADRLQQEQTAMIRRAAEANEKMVAQMASDAAARQSWQAIEREHMKVCERRYRQLRADESMELVGANESPRKH